MGNPGQSLQLLKFLVHLAADSNTGASCSSQEISSKAQQISEQIPFGDLETCHLSHSFLARFDWPKAPPRCQIEQLRLTGQILLHLLTSDNLRSSS
jgi:hypothetical protein